MITNEPNLITNEPHVITNEPNLIRVILLNSLSWDFPNVARLFSIGSAAMITQTLILFMFLFRYFFFFFWLGHIRLTTL